MEKKESLLKLGALVRKLRNDKQLSQVELARKSNVNRNYIGMIERGEVNPTYMTLLSIAKSLGTSINIK